MNNIKLYANTVKTLKQLFQVIEMFSKDVATTLELEKSRTQYVNSGVFEQISKPLKNRRNHRRGRRVSIWEYIKSEK